MTTVDVSTGGDTTSVSGQEEVVTLGVLGFCYQSSPTAVKECSTPRLGYNLEALHTFDPTVFTSWSTPISNALVFHVIAFSFCSLEMAAVILSFLKITSIGEWISEITLFISATTLAALAVDLSLSSSIATSFSSVDNTGQVLEPVISLKQGTWYSLIAFVLLFLGACQFKIWTKRSRQSPSPSVDRTAEQGEKFDIPPSSLIPPSNRPQVDKPNSDVEGLGEIGPGLLEFIDTTSPIKVANNQPNRPRKFLKSLPPTPVSMETAQAADDSDLRRSQSSGPLFSPPRTMRIIPKRRTGMFAGTDRYSSPDSPAGLSNDSRYTIRSSYSSQSPTSTRRTTSIPFAPSSYQRGTSISSSPLPYNPNIEVPEDVVLYLDPSRASSSCLDHIDSASSTKTRKSFGQFSIGGSSVFLPARASSVFMHPNTRPPSQGSNILSKKPSTKSQRSRMSMAPRTPFMDTFPGTADYPDVENSGAIALFQSLRALPRVPEPASIPEVPKMPRYSVLQALQKQQEMLPESLGAPRGEVSDSFDGPQETLPRDPLHDLPTRQQETPSHST
ncbi:hypothetical protein JR316_0000388 [Psilocybe cubensis]|nr:hypothetical protein JR316_0000388 [Psilocybe cubensis]KAH9486324.1 hypothetical protein JR316_0000388 [Psilocybe cubensis]